MTTDEPECITCDGNGVILVEVAGPDHFGNYDAEEIDCRDCDGTGRCPASRCGECGGHLTASTCDDCGTRHS